MVPGLPLHFCILQVIKTGQWEGLGRRLSTAGGQVVGTQVVSSQWNTLPTL